MPSTILENILKFIFGSELQHQREDNKDTTCSMNSLDVFNSKGRNIEKEESQREKKRRKKERDEKLLEKSKNEKVLLRFCKI
jgi:hypothetical protein